MSVLPENEAFALGFHDAPDAEALGAMSFVELASEIASARLGSPKYLVLERELKRVLAKDQAKENRSNIYIGALLAGLFGLSGVILGWWLRETSSMEKPTNSSALHQIEQSGLTQKPPATSISAIQPVASQPVSNPTPADNNRKNGHNVPQHTAPR